MTDEINENTGKNLFDEIITPGPTQKRKRKKGKSRYSLLKYSPVVIIPVLIILGFIFFPNSTSPKEPLNENDLQTKSDLELIDLDMRENFSFLSEDSMEEIKQALQDGHKMYPFIPIILPYATCRVESDLRYWLEHPKVTLQSGRNKGKTIQCCGIAAIQWEEWGDKLIAAGIAKKRSDLFKIKQGILACYFVSAIGIKNDADKITSKNISQIYSVNYFGGGSWNGKTATDYKHKLIQYTSELWMLKVAKDISRTFPKAKNESKR